MNIGGSGSHRIKAGSNGRSVTDDGSGTCRKWNTMLLYSIILYSTSPFHQKQYQSASYVHSYSVNCTVHVYY